MVHGRFADLQSRPTEFLDFTSLTLDEFQQLVPPFEAAFQARMAAWRLDGSCSSTLRIIRSARASGTISPFHDRVRGLCHDSTAIFLPTSGLGTPLVVCDAALRLAQPMRGFTTQAIQASAATAQSFQRPEDASWHHSHAPLCRLRAGPRLRKP